MRFSLDIIHIFMYNVINKYSPYKLDLLFLAIWIFLNLIYFKGVLTMRAIIKEPFKKAVEKEIEPGLKTLQQLVGGLIENVYELEDHNINIWINEEGKLINLDPNFLIYDKQDVVVGTAVFVGYDPKTGSDVSLNDEQISIIEQYLKKADFINLFIA